MRRVLVQVKQKDKGSKELTLLNLRDEIVNILYKDTVAMSTKSDMQFYIILFFISIQVGNKTFLESILDDGIPKFKKLNQTFVKRKGYLHANEYAQLVRSHGLSELFENDIFFVLMEAVLNADEIIKKYSDFIEKNPSVKEILEKLNLKYASQLDAAFDDFKSKRIQDDRYDENGNYHDLSKSVYRTVRMRNSRNLDLNLQRYTAIKEITSNSPIDFTFVQYLDPQIIFDLWEKYHLAAYVQTIAPEVVEKVSAHVDFQVHLGDLVTAWLVWRLTDGRKEKPAKEHAKDTFEQSKVKHGQVLNDLNLELEHSVLNANDRLMQVIEDLKAQRRTQLGVNIAMQNKKAIKKLEERIAQLENLIVSAKVIDDENQI